MQVIGTAGHVDHGKSTLVRALTGIDPDRFAEEKRRGLTIDLGFAWMELPSGSEIAIVDVPGHERFIKNMLAGAGSVSVCLFVVDATEGWKPQSAEHLAILDVLEVSRGVVVLSKKDAVDEGTFWGRIDEVRGALSPTRLRDLPVIGCSAVTGEGLEELKHALDQQVRDAPVPSDEGLPRLWVDRVFTMTGAGTVVTGTLWGGTLASGQEVELLPSGRRARVRTIQSHKKEHSSVDAGNRVALNLSGLERAGAERGDAVVAPGWWRTTRHLDVIVEVSPVGPRPRELTEKGSFLLYAGSAETPVTIRLLDKPTVQPGEKAFAHLVLRDPLPLRRDDRFVLRDAGRVTTLGGGRVLDPLAPRPAHKDLNERVELLGRIQEASPQEALEALLEHHGRLPIAEALFRAGLAGVPAEVHKIGATLASRSTVDDLRTRLTTLLAQHHARHPLQKGPAQVQLGPSLELSEQELADLISLAPEVSSEGTNVRLVGHVVELDPEQAEAKRRLLAAVEAPGFSPPMASELQADPALIKALVEAGDLVKIDGFYLTAGQAREVRSRVRSEIAERGPLTVAQIRDLLATSRRYAVPLCEWLDSTGATRRRGDVRELGPRE